MAITENKAQELKNGQHIQVKHKGRWKDGLFVEYNVYGVYATFMTPYDRYGTQEFFDLNEVRVKK